jgi:hypothetical protein
MHTQKCRMPNFTLDTCIPKDKDPLSINGGWISAIDLGAWGDSGYRRIWGDMNESDPRRCHVAHEY